MPHSKIGGVVLTGIGNPANVLRFSKELSLPTLRPGEILVKVNACSINPIDAWMTTGYLYGLMQFVRPLPCVALGRDFSGVVAAVNPSLGSQICVGEEVMGVCNLLSTQHQGFAEYVTVPSSFVVSKPANVTHSQAAASVFSGTTAYHAIRELGLSSSQRVLIHGASGSVGSFATILASEKGLEVHAMASAEKHDWMKSIGANHVWEYMDNNVWEKLEQIRFDGVLETISGEDHEMRSSRLLRSQGRLTTTVAKHFMDLDKSPLIGVPTMLIDYLRAFFHYRLQDVNYRWVLNRPDQRALHKVKSILEMDKYKPEVHEIEASDVNSIVEKLQHLLNRTGINADMKRFGKAEADKKLKQKTVLRFV